MIGHVVSFLYNRRRYIELESKTLLSTLPQCQCKGSTSREPHHTLLEQSRSREVVFGQVIEVERSPTAKRLSDTERANCVFFFTYDNVLFFGIP